MEEQFPVNHQRLPDGSERIVVANESGMLLVQLTQSNMRVEYERRFPAYLVPQEPVDHEQAYSGELERFIHDGRTTQDLLRKIAGKLDHDGTEAVVSVADQSNVEQAWTRLLKTF